MRICLVTSSYPRFEQDGNARFVRSIAEAQAALGHDVHVVAPYAPGIQLYPSPVSLHWFRYVWPARWSVMGHGRSLQADIRLRPLAFILLPVFLVAAFVKLMQVTGRHQSQVIHVHWVLPNGLVAAWVAALRGIPFVISLHGSDVFVARHNRVFGAVARWVFRRAAGVTACSPDLLEAALALDAPREVLLLPWGADPSVFHPGRRSPAGRSAFGWDESELIVAAVGRMVYKKGFEVLLQAFPSVVERHPRVRLVFGGDGPLLAELSRQANELGIADHVTFAGRIAWDRVPDLLAAADVFVLPSVRDQSGNLDGLPTVLLEAMSSGLAVVASNIGGASLVIDDRQSGLLVPAGDAEALAHALVFLAENDDERRRLGQAARRAVETHLNWLAITRQIVELLERVVSSNASEQSPSIGGSQS